MKDYVTLVNIEEAFHPPVENAEQSLETHYEALMSVSLAIGTHRDIEGLFSALAAALLRVVDFDFIGIAHYDEMTSKVDWHLSKAGGDIERGTIDATKEKTISEWVYQLKKPHL